jgi:hypothetical protein
VRRLNGKCEGRKSYAADQPAPVADIDDDAIGPQAARRSKGGEARGGRGLGRDAMTYPRGIAYHEAGHAVVGCSLNLQVGGQPGFLR